MRSQPTTGRILRLLAVPGAYALAAAAMGQAQPNQDQQPPGDQRVATAEARADFPDTPRPGTPMTVGAGRFAAPETVLWDDREDVYLVSNVNGELAAADGNGFISRVAPDGTIVDLTWIDGKRPEVELHGPKGMIFDGDRLLVADVGGVRVFDRSDGAPIRAYLAPDSHMLNDLALLADGALYVTDTGAMPGQGQAGAVYRFDRDGNPTVIATGRDLNRPNGIVADGENMIIAPYGSSANELYTMTPEGMHEPYATVPDPQLDGLLRLPDQSLLVTSWAGSKIFRLTGQQASTFIDDVSTPAQMDYDSRRNRLLVPMPRENAILFYPLLSGQ